MASRLVVAPINAYREPLLDLFDVSVQPAGGGPAMWARDVGPGGRAAFDVELEPLTVKVFPMRYRPTVRTFFVHTDEYLVEPVCPINPERVTGYEWPAEPPAVDGLGWHDLTDLQRAGFLNVWGKARATGLGDGTNVAGLVVRVHEVRRDRTFFEVVPGASIRIAEAAAAGIFRKSSGSLHHPPPGYTSGGSWKTLESVGNGQYTAFLGEPELVDWDVDENQGVVRHLFDVAKHHLTDEPTHPVDVHEILTYAQGLELGYRPLV